MDGSTWVGNFECSGHVRNQIVPHPDQRRLVVSTDTTLWCVDVEQQLAKAVGPAPHAIWVHESGDLVVDCQGLSIYRLGRSGVIWYTPRISWDGIRSVRISQDQLDGEAWSPIENCWLPFSVDLSSGAVKGGSYSGPEMRFDQE